MKHLKCYTILGIFFVLILGALWHFLYDWTNNNFIIGFFAPVNESTWEHMKLAFFPMLLYSFVMVRNLKERYPCITSSVYFGTLLGTILIPVIFYTYTGVLGYDVFVLDLFTFVLSVIIAFYATYKFTLSCRLQDYAVFLYNLICIVTICFLLFSYFPPDLGLFAAPAI